MEETKKRSGRSMDAAAASYDIAGLITQLKSEDTWKSSDRNSITLNMGTGLRLVVVALHDGAVIQPHQAGHPISFQVLEGEVEFTTDTQKINLTKGQILTLHKDMSHGVRALNECAFLLTFGA